MSSRSRIRPRRNSPETEVRLRSITSQVSGTDTERKARKSVARVMKQLQRSVAIARRAAKKGRISAACAEAIGRAVGNAQSQAEPWLSTRAR